MQMAYSEVMHILYVKSFVFMNSYDTNEPVKFVRIVITRLSLECRNMMEICLDLMYYLIYKMSWKKNNKMGGVAKHLIVFLQQVY